MQKDPAGRNLLMRISFGFFYFWTDDDIIISGEYIKGIINDFQQFTIFILVYTHIFYRLLFMPTEST